MEKQKNRRRGISLTHLGNSPGAVRNSNGRIIESNLNGESSSIVRSCSLAANGRTNSPSKPQVFISYSDPRPIKSQYQRIGVPSLVSTTTTITRVPLANRLFTSLAPKEKPIKDSNVFGGKPGNLIEIKEIVAKRLFCEQPRQFYQTDRVKTEGQYERPTILGDDLNRSVHLSFLSLNDSQKFKKNRLQVNNNVVSITIEEGPMEKDGSFIKERDEKTHSDIFSTNGKSAINEKRTSSKNLQYLNKMGTKLNDIAKICANKS